MAGKINSSHRLERRCCSKLLYKLFLLSPQEVTQLTVIAPNETEVTSSSCVDMSKKKKKSYSYLYHEYFPTPKGFVH
jgi:hypothetical protein